MKKAKSLVSSASKGMTKIIPDKFYLVAGHSEGMTKLNAFDNALMDSGVGNTNIVKMSSILPPASKEIKPAKLPPGALVPMAYASKISAQPGEIISAAVACAVPVDKKQNGVIMEYSASGHKEEVENIVRNMAVEALKQRKLKVKEVHSISVQHGVSKIGAVYAALVLWW
ncbi:MAG: arginine decarboxylase, pyruvoyl-dependent [Spirochaetia bacterium]|nr:arginine decarboxylase, pyruvoyl-dependent [Spirochaetia bacterium]